MNYIAQEDPILLSEIVDQIFLVAIDPASNGEHEELQRIGLRERRLARDGQHQIRRGRFASADFSHPTRSENSVSDFRLKLEAT